MFQSKKTKLFGSDLQGTVYDLGDKIVRKIKSPYFEQVSHIYALYLKHHLSTGGIVKTVIDRGSRLLIHKKHPITYPHEWTYSMYKDSILFQLHLVIKLDKYGLTLKDFLPNNIVFNYSELIFVDFLSLIYHHQLKQEKWLYVGIRDKTTNPYKLLFSKMFIPHLLIPLLLYARHNYVAGRKILETKACNLGNGRPAWKDVFQRGGFWQPNSLISIARSLWLANFPDPNYINSIQDYSRLIKAINITDTHSAYLNYYEAKGEEYSYKSKRKWKKKQSNIYRIIHSLKPWTTLDIGANTGWYSFLAEKEGSRVIATDIDEGTIDSLYLKVKNTHHNLLPLALSFADFIRPTTSKAYIHPTKRFRSDLVMCLALVHHLVLGQGHSVKIIIQTLAKLSKKVVILEFVDISDDKIQQDPAFFPQINGPASHTYNLSEIVKLARRYFTRVEIQESTEATRKLLVFYH